MKRLVLLGGGHAQVQAVKAFSSDPPRDTAVVLINRSRLTPYSGMLPGLIAGHYTRADSHIDLGWLCAQGDIAFVEKEVIGLDLAARRLTYADGRSEAYDLLSIDTGSEPATAGVPGAAEHALPVKPIERFLLEADALVDACRSPGKHDIALVGGGAAGFEVLLALAYRIDRQANRRGTARLTWITDAAEVLPGFPDRARKAALDIVERWQVGVRTHARVERVSAGAVELADGTRIGADHIVWATGAQSTPMFAQAGLRTDERGFIAVDASLQSLSHPDVFASGDIATVLPHPRPKAGVFAVRQGPSLTRNLRLALDDRPPLPFVPQKRFLVILSAGERYAIATKAGLAVQGRWVWTWKDHIDRRFMARFQPPRGSGPILTDCS